MRPVGWLFALLFLIAAATAAEVKVIDGDTFEIDGVRVRIENIDAPELHSARCPDERRLALRAATRLGEILAGSNWTLVRSPTDPRDEDRYGRKLRRVALPSGDAGEVLVAEGLARRWNGSRRGWC